MKVYHTIGKFMTIQIRDLYLMSNIINTNISSEEHVFRQNKGKTVQRQINIKTVQGKQTISMTLTTA
jgi:hypothetical protein